MDETQRARKAAPGLACFLHYFIAPMTTPADLIAVQRVYADQGEAAALAEIRRRWPMIAENVIAQTLERILAVKTAPPPPYDERGRPVVDGRRRPRKPQS